MQKIISSLIFAFLSLQGSFLVAADALAAEDAAEIENILQQANAGLDDAIQQAQADAAEFEEPGFLHQISYAREAALEALDKQLKKPVLSSQGPVPRFELHPELIVDDPARIVEIINNPANPHLAVLVEDLLEPLLYGANFVFDSNSLGAYFDDVIEAISETIIAKEDVVLYNLEGILTTNSDRFVESTLKILDEYLQESLQKNDRMKRLAVKFFKRRIPGIITTHIGKRLQAPPLITHPAPVDLAAPPAANVISFNHYLPVKLLGKPLLAGFRSPLENKLNALISGYENSTSQSLVSSGIKITSTLMSETMSALISQYLGDALQSGTASFLDCAVEFSKQKEYIGTFDESLFFTIGAELIYDLWFFHRTLDAFVRQQLVNMLARESVNLHKIIQRFERNKAKPANNNPVMMAQLNAQFHEEVYAIVMRNFGPHQPILLSSLRRGHEKFRSYINLALLIPVVWKFAPAAWEGVKIIFDLWQQRRHAAA
jgi:hypothetical protein